KDWVGVWAVGQPDTDVTRIAVKYTGGAAAGSVTLTIPGTTAPGSYEIRLFANDSWTRLAISDVFVVTAPSTSAALCPFAKQTLVPRGDLLKDLSLIEPFLGQSSSSSA